MRNCTTIFLSEVIVHSCDVYLVLAFILSLIVSFFLLALILQCAKSDRYYGAIDENKNLDIGLYIRNHREYIRTMKRIGQIEHDFPSWPQNVTLPYRPWDNEYQVAIY